VYQTIWCLLKRESTRLPDPQRNDNSGHAAASSGAVEVLRYLLARRELTPAQVRSVLSSLIAGSIGEAEAAALLVAWRMKGETAAEIAAGACLLRENMVRWNAGVAEVIDTCGTGGDGTCTFNISTATALVVAAVGVPVVKHGNRSVSSRSGSVDVLAALGITPSGDADSARKSLEKCGIAFCFAPGFHPALKRLAPLRQRLGVPTFFNWLGPLANPAGAAYQLLGVGRGELLDPVAGALAILGTRRALVVCSRDGLDEVSLSAPTMVREISGGEVKALEWSTADFGLEPCALADLRADGPEASAAMVRAVLGGEAGAATRIVTANAAAALVAAERAGSLAEGVALATAALTSGRALAVLNALASAT
jgi:anthranilate phosphoribosyltransferase